jgi:hypothetical protein
MYRSSRLEREETAGGLEEGVRQQQTATSGRKQIAPQQRKGGLAGPFLCRVAPAQGNKAARSIPEGVR